jgi:hypothetical protein
MAARQQARIGPELGEQLQGMVDACRALVFKWGRDLHRQP